MLLRHLHFTCSQATRVMQAVHDERVVHADLKPANFVLVSGQVKLIDFGIAKACSRDTTAIFRENVTGTVRYMSPEALKSAQRRHHVLPPQHRLCLGGVLWLHSLNCPTVGTNGNRQVVHHGALLSAQMQWMPCHQPLHSCGVGHSSDSMTKQNTSCRRAHEPRERRLVFGRHPLRDRLQPQPLPAARGQPHEADDGHLARGADCLSSDR